MAKGQRLRDRAILTRRPPTEPTRPRYGASGWRPGGMGNLPPQNQIGVYGDAVLNQFPARLDGVQLHQGVESMSSRWFTPTATYVPSFLVTQQLQNLPGGQRIQSRYTGPLGPISSRQLSGSVVAAQIRQSGLSAMEWARGLAGEG